VFCRKGSRGRGVMAEERKKEVRKVRTNALGAGRELLLLLLLLLLVVLSLLSSFSFFSSSIDFYHAHSSTSIHPTLFQPPSPYFSYVHPFLACRLPTLPLPILLHFVFFSPFSLRCTLLKGGL